MPNCRVWWPRRPTSSAATGSPNCGRRARRWASSTTGCSAASATFRDSGMAGTPSIRHPRAFARAAAGGPDHRPRSRLLVAVIDEVRPDVLLTYDADGGYGHPDHVAAHQVSLAAVSTASWRVRRVLAVVRPRTATVAAFDALAVAGPPDGYLPAEAADTGFLVDDEAVAFGVPVGGSAAAKRRPRSRRMRPRSS